MGDIHYIVDKLNSPPFEYNLSLLSFSEKNGHELLQLLSDVFSGISPKHQKIDISKESLEATVDRLVGFLKIVKYKPNVQDALMFRQLVASADKEVIYSILKWVVPQPQVLEKRAFVGYYLSFPDMPEEFNFDADIMEIKEDIKQRQAEFIDLHKSSEVTKGLAKDMQSLKGKIKVLEEEKERLAEKVERAKGQVDKVQDRASYIDVCTALRKQQDEEVSLSQALQTQRQVLEKAEGSYHRVAARLRELQSSHQDGSAQKLMDALEEDVKNLRFQVSERYPKEVEKRQKRLQALNEAFSSGANTEIDLQRLQQQANNLHQQINEIQERRTQQEKARAGDKAFLQLRQAQQMAAMVARKKEDLQARQERLQEKKAAVTAQLDKLAAEGGAKEGPVFSEEEWRAKYESMKQKLPLYKKMKKELGDVEAEVFVLAHTEELLQALDSQLTDQVRKIERQQGVSGFADVAQNLEKVSEAKSQIDEEKGMTLAEISRTVEEINSAINQRKQQLAPQIKKLRSVRQNYAEFEGQYTDKKSSYDRVIGEYESRTHALETEVTALKEELSTAEAQYHTLGCQLAVVDTNIRKVTSGPTAEVLRDKYQAKISSADDACRQLREKQRELKDFATTGASQIDMLSDMLRLLQIKLELVRGPGGAPAAVGGGGMGGGGGGGGGLSLGAGAVGQGGGMMGGPRVALKPMGAPGGGGGANVLAL